MHYTGKVIQVDGEELEQFAKQHKIANCEIVDGTCKSIDVLSIKIDKQFNKHIAEKYERHTILTALLGRPMTFKYSIEGNEVKLKEYTGESKDIIIPKFITSIMAFAFVGHKIETINLERGLKYIGNAAFEDCRIKEITIPDTVEFIGQAAFFGNKRLVNSKGEYTNKVKILNRDALIVIGGLYSDNVNIL